MFDNLNNRMNMREMDFVKLKGKRNIDLFISHVLRSSTSCNETSSGRYYCRIRHHVHFVVRMGYLTKFTLQDGSMPVCMDLCSPSIRNSLLSVKVQTMQSESRCINAKFQIKQLGFLLLSSVQVQPLLVFPFHPTCISEMFPLLRQKVSICLLRPAFLNGLTSLLRFTFMQMQKQLEVHSWTLGILEIVVTCDLGWEVAFVLVFPCG